MTRKEGYALLKEKRALRNQLIREILDLEEYLQVGKRLTPKQSKEIDVQKRNTLLYRDFKEGMTRRELMKKHDLRYERVCTIINREKYKEYDKK